MFLHRKKIIFFSKLGNISPSGALTSVRKTLLARSIFDQHKIALPIYKEHDVYYMLVPNRFQIPQVFIGKLQHSPKKYFRFLKYQLKSTLGAQRLVQMWSALPFRKALIIPNNFYFSHFALKCSFQSGKYKIVFSLKKFFFSVWQSSKLY